MFWIEFRNPADHRTPSETVRFETDEWSEAFRTLRGVVESPGATLIDFSGNMDGDLDHLLAGVKLFPADEPVKVV